MIIGETEIFDILVDALDTSMSKISVSPMIMDFQTKKDPSSHLMISDIILEAAKDQQANSQLALLAHDNDAPNEILPSMDWFRSNVFPEFPLISAKQIGDAAACNCFGFAVGREPSKAEKVEMCRTIGIQPTSCDFIEGMCVDYQ